MNNKTNGKRATAVAFPRTCMIVLSGLAGMVALPSRAADTSGFDLNMLKERGIDPQLAEYFREAARFRPGTQIVTLFVNGAKRGRVDARFNAKGELCFDRELLDKGGLIVPSQLSKTEKPATSGNSGNSGNSGASAAKPVAACYDYKEAYPQTQIELRPGKEEVSLIVPTTALRPTEDDFAGYSSGGTAALLNYDLIGVNNKYAGSSSRFMSANAELGFNFRDWIVRSREVYTAQDNNSQRQHVYAYAQHTLMDYKSIFQAGQINIANSAVSGGAITGAQIIPETALMSLNRNNVMVEGIVQSQARVEVRQAGALIYTTIVPTGPFALSDLPLLNSGSDLEVTIVEANGAQRRFIVPAASLHSGSLGSQRGYSFAIGRQRSLGSSNARQPWIITGSGGWKVGKESNVNAGLMAATSYQAAAWGMDTSVLNNTSISLQQRLSNATNEGVHGTQISLSSSSLLGASISGSFSATQQTLGYRDLADTTVDTSVNSTEMERNRYRGQYTTSVNWSSMTLGAFNLSYSRSSLFSGVTTQRLTGAWGQTFSFGTVSFNIEHNLGNNSNTDSNTNGNSINSLPANIFYLTLSIPLGSRSIRTYVNNSSGYKRLGASYNETVNEYANYTMSAERNAQSQETDLSAQASLLPRYAQVNLGYARAGSGATSYNGGIRGGMVLHQNGLTLSPYPVQDTFGILSVGDESGIRVSTPYGPVWTDPWGQAVISQMAPYTSSRLEIATKSLPRNVDIKNGYKIVEPGRGSVNFVTFDTIKVRRILLNAKGANGEPLPKGAFVLDDDSQFVTTVVDDGQIFLINGVPNSKLHVSLPDGNQCTLQYELPAKADPEKFFETSEARCGPSLHAHMEGPPYAHS
ncbi:fimbria/pilus outer membrane usher protein [Herbaspirillum sp. RV1423]|uniref:fimbria/pilus outer membrane usher protein n=1 Tax=Herbaspirillum sp. RV1423 TaxID=1443993 RepID=UPI001E283D36|nr:fimbria/pilus outer membrane usher protein [Herbaspirillum sp. RV1423]